MGQVLAAEFSVELQCSNGWLDQFMRRNCLSIRRATNKPILSADELSSRGACFIRHIRDIISREGIELSDIYNVDETAIFADAVDDTTVDFTGSTSVQIGATGFEKLRFTGIVAASASGRKLRPVIIEKGTTLGVVPSERYITLHNKISWINAELFKRWIEFEFPPLVRRKCLLVFDSARAHIGSVVKDYLHSRNTVLRHT